MENGEGEWLSTLDDFRLRLIRDCFKFHGREDRPILGETEFRKVFALDMQANGLADIESQFIQGGSLRDHGKVEALGHKLAFAFGNAHLNCSLHRWFARLRLQYASRLPCAIGSRLDKRCKVFRLPLRLRLPLQPRAIQNSNLMTQDANQSFRPEACQVAGNHLPHGAQSRRQFLMGERQVELVGAGQLGGVQHQSRQPRGHAAERHGLNHPHEVPQPVSHHRQDLQRDIGVLPADLLKIVLVEEQGNHRLHRPHRCWIRSAVEKRELRDRGGSRLQRQHHLASPGGGLEDLDAAVHDEENAGARLALPEKHFAGAETALHGALRERLKLALAQAG